MVPLLRRGDGPCRLPTAGSFSGPLAAADSISERALGGEAGAAGVAVGGGVLLLDDEQRAVRERLLHRCQVAGWFRGLTGG